MQADQIKLLKAQKNMIYAKFLSVSSELENTKIELKKATTYNAELLETHKMLQEIDRIQND